ncbi:hypothetical protein ABK040_007598 [Willaertia magna]
MSSTTDLKMNNNNNNNNINNKKENKTFLQRFFSISKQFSNYYHYHQLPINQFIHFIFVPFIAFSLIMLVWRISLKNFLFIGFNSEYCNLAVYSVILLCIYYLLLDLFVGTLLTIQFTSFLFLTSYLNHNLNNQNYFLFAIAVQIIGWGTQFFGHWLEGRRPALIDNVFQIFIAPMFVLLEMLFKLGLKLDIKREAEEYEKNKIN